MNLNLSENLIFKKTYIIGVGILLFLIVWSISSCRDDSFITDSDAKLSFNTDTVLFDTLFTKLGSATRSFMVYNNHDKSIKISSIHLAGGNNSPYRINIDGDPSYEIEDYTLLPNDSIYIFVDVNIDPNASNLPYIVKDSIVFITNGNIQDIKLMAWGQNAHFLSDSMLVGDIVWTDDLPYVISNHIGIDENSKLTIMPGVKVFSDNWSAIFVWGTLEILGDTNNPVYFQGVRPEEYYKNIPGQWWGIHFIRESKNNYIRNCYIRNGTIGITVDSLPINPPNPNLVLENVRIENMTMYGILGRSAYIRAFNTLINNCCQYLLIADLGGTYEFYHSTFAHYGRYCTSRYPALAFYNYDNKIYKNDLNVTIANSIIWGAKEEELEMKKTGNGEFNVLISHCLISSKNAGLDINNNIRNKDPGFISPYDYNFRPDSVAIIVNKGDPSYLTQFTILQNDMEGKSRVDQKPDLGVYEREN